MNGRSELKEWMEGGEWKECMEGVNIGSEKKERMEGVNGRSEWKE
jgi:hypothetical protein